MTPRFIPFRKTCSARSVLHARSVIAEVARFNGIHCGRVVQS